MKSGNNCHCPSCLAREPKLRHRLGCGCLVCNPMTIANWIAKYVETGAATDCWLWIGSTDPGGYGRAKLSINGKREVESSHRLAWRHHHGDIPVGGCVLHRCDNRRCCNPGHLFLGTQADNVNDMIAKGRHNFVLTRANAARTHCIHGHLFDARNTLIVRGTHRHCRTCDRLRHRRYAAQEAGLAR